MKIWVVLPDYGYDGYGAALGAYLSEERAKQAVKEFKKSPYNTNDYEICEIELEEGNS